MTKKTVTYHGGSLDGAEETFDSVPKVIEINHTQPYDIYVECYSVKQAQTNVYRAEYIGFKVIAKTHLTSG